MKQEPAREIKYENLTFINIAADDSLDFKTSEIIFNRVRVKGYNFNHGKNRGNGLIVGKFIDRGISTNQNTYGSYSNTGSIQIARRP